MIRQGDVLFIPVAEGVLAKAIAEKGQKHPKGLIQEGEVTGHHHRLATIEDAEVFEVEHWQDNQKFVRVGPNGVSIVHEEHHTVTLPPGSYKVHIAREFDYLANIARAVRD